MYLFFNKFKRKTSICYSDKMWCLLKGIGASFAARLAQIVYNFDFYSCCNFPLYFYKE